MLCVGDVLSTFGTRGPFGPLLRRCFCVTHSRHRFWHSRHGRCSSHFTLRRTQTSQAAWVLRLLIWVGGTSTICGIGEKDDKKKKGGVFQGPRPKEVLRNEESMKKRAEWNSERKGKRRVSGTWEWESWATGPPAIVRAWAGPKLRGLPIHSTLRTVLYSTFSPRSLAGLA